MKKFDVCAVVGKYTNANGEEKTRWINCGAVFEKEGRLSLKLECVPVGEWNGFFSLFEPRPRDRQATAPQSNETPSFDDDEIPAF